MRNRYFDLQGHLIDPKDIQDQLNLLGKTEEQCEAFFLPLNWTRKGFAWNWLVSTTTMLKWTEREGSEMDTSMDLPDFGYTFNNDKHNAAIDAAEQAGFTIRVAAADELLLDLDTEAAEAQFNKHLPLVDALFGVLRTERWLSKSREAHHVVIKLRDVVSNETRLGLQAALGSDGQREIINLKRIQIGETRPSVLFKPKQEVLE